jgi:hypothetical protein
MSIILNYQLYHAIGASKYFNRKHKFITFTVNSSFLLENQTGLEGKVVLDTTTDISVTSSHRIAVSHYSSSQPNVPNEPSCYEDYILRKAWFSRNRCIDSCDKRDAKDEIIL